MTSQGAFREMTAAAHLASILPDPTRIGKYEIDRELGRGPLTQVYRGFDPTVGRPVAIKVLLDDDDRELGSQFRRQAAAAANLRHKNIVTVYELGEQNGAPFVAMEYVEGTDLWRLMEQRRPLSLLQKMLIMWQVAEALQCAHQHDGVHLDLKPANIMLVADGTVKMMDFGMVRVSEERARGLTEQGYLEEEILYRAPEQLRSSAGADKLADIFAYGVIYYELLAGQHPFAAADARAVMTRIAREDPEPVSRLVSGCPEALEEVIRRALQKDPDLRYQSIEDVQFDLEPVLEELKQQHAQKLLAEARQMTAEEQLEAARGLLREALELDAANQEARELLDRIRQQQQRQAIRSRIEALLKQGEEAHRLRRFDEAVEALEAALRLDAGNAAIRSQMEQSRHWQERSHRAAALVGEAKREMQLQRLEPAWEKLLQALEHDSQDQEAARLLERVEKEIEEQEQQKKLQEGLVRAQDLMQAGSFDAAIDLLLALQLQHPSSKLVPERLAEARREKAGRERQQRLETGLVAAQDLMKRQRVAEAEESLEALSEEFGGEPAVRKLLSESREELHRCQQALAAFRHVLEEGKRLIAQGRPDLAIAMLKKGSAKFPEQAEELESLLASARAALPECDKRRFIEETMARVAALEQRQQWHTAVTLLEEALQRYPGTAELGLCAARVRSRSEHSERQQKLARRIVLIQQKIAEQAWPLALRLIEASERDFPGEPEWQRLVEEVYTAQRRSECETLVARIEQAMADGELDAVREALRKGLELYPEEQRFQTLWGEFDREKAYRKDLRSAELLIGQRRFEHAETVLLDLKARRPKDPNVEALLEAARLGRFQQQPERPATVGAAQAKAQTANPVWPASAATALQPGPSFLRYLAANVWRVCVGILVILAVAVGFLVWKLSRNPPAPSEPATSPVVQPQNPPAAAAETAPAAAPAPNPESRPTRPAGAASTSDAPQKPTGTRATFDPSLLESRPARAAALIADAPPLTSASVGHLPATNLGRIIPSPGVAPPRPEPEAAVPTRPERIRLGGNFQEPKLVTEARPQLPALARDRAVYGVVKLELTVGTDGVVKDVTVVSGHPFLVMAAKQAAMRRRYRPALLNGEPTEVKIPVQMVFEPKS